MRDLKFAVIGAGAGGTLMAVQLKSKGFRVTLMDKNKEIVDKMNEIGYLKATGKTEAQVRVDLITTNIKECIEDADIIRANCLMYGASILCLVLCVVIRYILVG